MATTAPVLAAAMVVGRSGVVEGVTGDQVGEMGRVEGTAGSYTKVAAMNTSVDARANAVES